MPSLASFMIGADGSISSAAVEHYRRRAAGGPAMVIIEACAVSPEGIVSPNQARIHHDRFVDGLAEIAAAIRKEGSIPAIQLHHGVRLFTECRLEKVAPDGAWIADKEHRRRLIRASKVLIAVGTRPDNRLFDEISGAGCEIHMIGDCRKPRDAKAAIYESAVLARRI